MAVARKRRAELRAETASERCFRAIAWNSWSEQTGSECGWTKTHLIETDRGVSAVGHKTLCGTTVPSNAERLDGCDIRTRPCARCLRAAGRNAVGRLALAKSAAKAFEELERW
jgi:coenzyme F420-reducing hydrogenase gamma subunit